MHHDDLFADTRMALGDHLEELRRHLGRAVAGLAAALTLVLGLDFLGYAADLPVGVARPVKAFISRPVEQELARSHERRDRRLEARLAAGEAAARAANEPREVRLELPRGRLAEVLGLPRPGPGEAGEYVAVNARVEPLVWVLLLEEARRRAGGRGLAALGPTEGMTAYFKVALACALVLASPWVFWQLWSFVAAGLYPHEKRPVHVYLPCSVGLFVAGILVCQFLVMPRAVEALLWFNEWIDLEPDLRFSEWLGFAVLLPLVFGLAFQTPLAMLAAGRLGVVTADDFRHKRRHAWFALAVLAAVITPSVDVGGLLGLWLSVSLLYELGILLCGWTARREDDVPEETAWGAP